MRILLVIDSLAWGGAQRQMANLAVGLHERGHDVHLFRYFLQLEQHYGALVADAGVTLLDFQKRRKFDPGVVRALADHMRRERYDVAAAFLPGPAAFTVIASQLAGGPPVIASERGSFREGRVPLYARLQRVTHRRAAHVTANSFHHAARMLQEFPWLAGRVSTIWNGIDIAQFRPANPARHSASGLRLLGVGTVVPIKDIETLARALVIASARGGPRIEVEWAGKLLDLEASREVVRSVDTLLGEAGLSDRWRWLGLQTDMPALYAQCDAVVHPSAREGLPNALCEALASGLPAIAANAADHARLIADGERGMLFPTGDADALADVLVRMEAIGPEGRSALGQRARRFAEESLSRDSFVAAWEVLLGRVARRQR